MRYFAVFSLFFAFFFFFSLVFPFFSSFFLPFSLFILMAMTWLMTPFVKSLTLSQVLLTYLIPVIPLVYAWDGQASLMRNYSFKDIESLLEGVKNPRYCWTLAPAKKASGKNLGYFIMGLPGKG